jgi:tRNA(Ile)-lysidine synthase TilS/MesJ
MQRKTPFNFEIKAFTIDYGMGENLEQLQNHCKKYNIPHEIIKTKIFDIAQEKMRENSSFCSFFSRMRRGSLYTVAIEQGYNKLALGHHLDDAIESFFMNMFYNGTLRTMPPIYKSDRGIWVIRPLIFLRERQFKAVIEKNNLTAIGDESCPAMKIEGKMPITRAKMKEFVAKMESENENIINMIKSSFCHISESSFFDSRFYEK